MQVAAFIRSIRSRGYSVRTGLTGIVAVILIPALLFGGWLTLNGARSERELLERNSESKAQQVLADIEHEIATAKAMLVALASSQFLQNEDFRGFQRQSADVARQLGAQVVLADAATGAQIVNANIPWGEPLPRDVPVQAVEARERAVAKGKPSVSSVFYGPVLKKFLISVGIPVMKNAAAAYYLAVGVPVDTFADSLRNAALPSQWVVTLVDRDNTVVARSERHGEFAGTKLRVDLVGRAAGSDGINTDVDRYGVTYRWIWRYSAVTGWYVVVGVPVSVLEAPARRALATYAAASGALFAIAMALSLWLGGRLSQSIGALGIDRTPTREEFRILFESAPNGVAVIDSGGRIVLANERLERKFGYAHAELTGKPAGILFPELFRDGDPASPKRVASDELPGTAAADRDPHGRRRDGSVFPVEIGFNPFTTRSGAFLIMTVVDITARVQSEKRLAAALAERDEIRRRLIQAQEDERLRLAHDLHDQTGQSLTAAMLELKALESLLQDEGKDRVRALRHSMEETGRTIHRIAWELRPASIDELGLASALANYIAEWSAQFGVETDFNCRDGRLDSIADEKRTAIYRIVQESLTNVAKHASGATSVCIIIDRLDSNVQLTVEDNGRGFETPASAADERNGGGLGLAGMRERLTLIGGNLEVESSVGVGTTIFARIPLDQERLTA